jgi:hypothetical protein
MRAGTAYAAGCHLGDICETGLLAAIFAASDGLEKLAEMRRTVGNQRRSKSEPLCKPPREVL